MSAPNAQARARDRHGLDWLNFFVANLQTAFGPFIAVYLGSRAWTQGEIGFAISVGAVTAMASQVPAGAAVDAIRSKRAAAACAVAAIVAACLMLATLPARVPVLLAEMLHGFASCMLGPAIAAISLHVAGLGTGALGDRLGRNARYAAVGSGVAAALMGATGYFVSTRAVFLLGAAVALPGFVALRMIGETASTRRMRPAGRERIRVMALLSDRRLLGFAVCIFSYHLANDAMLAVAAVEVTARAGRAAELIIAACILVPQMVVALISPRIGLRADRYGRKPLLIFGALMVTLRAGLFMLTANPYLLIAIEVVDGFSSAVFGVMLPLVAADIAGDSGRFNLCMGLLGLALGAGATLSHTIAGGAADHSANAAFLLLAGLGLLTALLVLLFVRETRRLHP